MSRGECGIWWGTREGADEGRWRAWERERESDRGKWDRGRWSYQRAISEQVLYISISVSSKQILLTMKCNKTKRVLEGRDIPSAFLQRRLALSFSRFLSLRSKIIVFAFICQRSIFQTSDKRGNWTGNRLECCKSTKHNYQKALKELNRIHILKMPKWMSRNHNEDSSSSLLCLSPPSGCKVKLLIIMPAEGREFDGLRVRRYMDP